MIRAILIIVFACALFAAPAFAEEDTGFKFKTNPKIKQARPKKPLKIELKRHEDGKYTWEISGGSVEEVLKADEELKEKLGVK
jgi:hypothetical protein